MLRRTIKFISNRINTDLQNLINLIQLKDTSEVTQWLKISGTGRNINLFYLLLSCSSDEKIFKELTIYYEYTLN